MPPPNTPEEGVLPSSATAGTSPPRTDGATTPPAVDLRLLDYETAVDENLICPICRVAFVQPVITNCDHVFCHRCLVQAHALSPVCPIDRLPLKLAADTRSAPKIVHNQLGSLQVRCPNHVRGCQLVVARSLVENHVTRYCDQTPVPCPHPKCCGTVVRKDVGKGCLHYHVQCEYCQESMQKADLEEHQDSECPDRETECELCATIFLRNKEEDHTKACPEVETGCKYAPFGCAHKMPRKLLEAHGETCEYRVVGPVGGQLAELRAELSALQEKDRLKDRRIKFLENKGFTMSPRARQRPYQYFLSLFETMESKVERVSSALQEVEGRQSMMLINETLQIKDQLTEIRSTLGVLGMHVRWLMNFRLQERGRVMAGSSTMSSSNPGNREPSSASTLPLPRRLSDTLRENPPRL
ncbi:hypothetical protein BKA67DRAFT_663133 [Truncatella angustata]|uniref:Uncharacterized protein n=1 Tax=Truncatella angustata TaxID=152316 RepID=A0A9P8RIM4_9PEZI|nr:uncharacterized protein BKA67DRAFT_663133 [Truncatella angustata]KAH6646733.1 hypothetical protein BKA67DRAFT_663133 [Truncatella angustata]